MAKVAANAEGKIEWMDAGGSVVYSNGVTRVRAYKPTKKLNT